MAMLLTDVEPKYGVNYNKGDIGFTYDSSNLPSKGIVYVTGWSSLSAVKVSHALIVSGENECIEAHSSTGVVKRKLSDYFDNSHCQIFFREPLGLSQDLADRIVQVAESQIGKNYDFDVLPDLLIARTHLGWSLNRVCQGKLEELIGKLHENDQKWICSELAAFCLDQQPEFHDQGILKKSNSVIAPQELFESKELFKPWKEQSPQTDVPSVHDLSSLPPLPQELRAEVAEIIAKYGFKQLLSAIASREKSLH